MIISTRMRLFSALAVTAFALNASMAPATENAQLPFDHGEYSKFIASIEKKAAGRVSDFVLSLRDNGFSCNFNPKKPEKKALLRCVRFGCKANSFGQKFLFQWSVTRPLVGQRGPWNWNENVIYYDSALKCLPANSIEDQQDRFLGEEK